MSGDMEHEQQQSARKNKGLTIFTIFCTLSIHFTIWMFTASASNQNFFDWKTVVTAAGICFMIDMAVLLGFGVSKIEHLTQIEHLGRRTHTHVKGIGKEARRSNGRRKKSTPEEG